MVGPRLKLVDFSEKFISERYISWLRDDEVNKYLVKAADDTTLEEAAAFCKRLIQGDEDYFLAITLAETGSHLGNLRIGPINKPAKAAQMGILIGEKALHGNGFGTEAVNLCVEHLFNNQDMHKLFVFVVDENRAAVKMWSKCGFETEGLLRDHYFLKGRYLDIRVMSLINPAGK